MGIFPGYKWVYFPDIVRMFTSLQVCVAKEKWMPSYAAWGETSTLGLDWVKNVNRLHFKP